MIMADSSPLRVGFIGAMGALFAVAGELAEVALVLSTQAPQW
jgi:hypothetical protein